jgi:hypothetical protein
MSRTSLRRFEVADSSVKNNCNVGSFPLLFISKLVGTRTNLEALLVVGICVGWYILFIWQVAWLATWYAGAVCLMYEKDG